MQPSESDTFFSQFVAFSQQLANVSDKDLSKLKIERERDGQYTLHLESPRGTSHTVIPLPMKAENRNQKLSNAEVVFRIAKNMERPELQTVAPNIDFNKIQKTLQPLAANDSDRTTADLASRTLKMNALLHEVQNTIAEVAQLDPMNAATRAPKIVQSVKALTEFQTSLPTQQYHPQVMDQFQSLMAALLKSLCYQIKSHPELANSSLKDIPASFIDLNSYTIVIDPKDLLALRAICTQDNALHQLVSQLNSLTLFANFEAAIKPYTKFPEAKKLYADMAIRDLLASAIKVREMASPSTLSRQPIEIHGQQYVAYGPKLAITEHGEKMKDFVTTIAQYPVVVNLMGTWELGQAGRHYVPPPENSERSKTLERYLSRMNALLPFVQPGTHVTDQTLLSPQQEKELIAAIFSDKLILSDETKSTIEALAKQAVASGDVPSSILRGMDHKALLRDLITNANRMLKTILPEEEAFNEFRKVYKEETPLSSDTRRASKRNDPNEQLLLVEFHERVDRDELKQNLFRLLAAAKAVSDVCNAHPGKPVYIHCDKSMVRTSMFLILLDLMRNRTLALHTDTEIYAHMHNTAKTFGLTAAQRNLEQITLEILFSPEFIKEFRRLASKDALHKER